MGQIPFTPWIAGSSRGAVLLGQTCDPAGQVVPFIPTPFPIARRMLELARVGPNDVVYDLGSGDGRIVVMAAEDFGACAVGVESDEKLVNRSRARIAQLRLGKTARIVHGDLFNSKLAPATVVTLYLSSQMNEQLRPLLEKELRHGARVVSEQCPVPGWKPQKVLKMKYEGVQLFTIFLYVRP